MFKIVHESQETTYFEEVSYDRAIQLIGEYSQFNNTMKCPRIIPMEAIWIESNSDSEIENTKPGWNWSPVMAANAIISDKPSKNWFVWDEEDGFQFFETEEAATHSARDKISTFFVDNEWGDGVESIVVGYISKQTKVVDLVETDTGYDCNYHLVKFEN